jgi:hypothetical protein
MSYKTDRLIDLFPDVYAAAERESVLYKILDAFGAEFMEVDERVKRLLKSHWVKYAEGSSLDKLGSIFSVSRRTLRNGQLESDEAFRLRLQSTVPLFTGGGTVQAIKGAVRSALGLPFNLDQLGLPPGFQALRDDIEQLVDVREFSPTGDQVLETTVVTVPRPPRGDASQILITVNASTVAEALPQITWTFDRGEGRRLSVVRLDSGQGFKSIDSFIMPAGKTIVFTAGVNNRLSAVVDGVEFAASFVNLDNSAPALIPAVPTTASQWQFLAQSGLMDVSVFDGNNSFDLPLFHVSISRVIFQPLTFDVDVPFFLQQAVNDLKERHGYTGEIFVFEGIPLDRIQQVVDQTRAAGVRGSVRFFIKFFETHNHLDVFSADITNAATDSLNMSEEFLAANTNQLAEVQNASERLTLAGLFDISRFEGPFGFM